MPRTYNPQRETQLDEWKEQIDVAGREIEELIRFRQPFRKGIRQEPFVPVRVPGGRKTYNSD